MDRTAARRASTFLVARTRPLRYMCALAAVAHLFLVRPKRYVESQHCRARMFIGDLPRWLDLRGRSLRN